MRLIALLLSMSVVALLTTECIRRWPVMPIRYRRVMPPLIAVFVVTAYGLGEAARQHAPLGFRVYAFTGCLLWLLAALVVNAAQKVTPAVYDDRQS